MAKRKSQAERAWEAAKEIAGIDTPHTLTILEGTLGAWGWLACVNGKVPTSATGKTPDAAVLALEKKLKESKR